MFNHCSHLQTIEAQKIPDSHRYKPHPNKKQTTRRNEENGNPSFERTFIGVHES